MSTKNQFNTTWLLLFFAWVVAIVSLLGSLFFSDVMEFVPCTLCWYQRIAMYPLVIIFLVGMLTDDKSVFKYSFVFVGLGWLSAFYHNLLQYGIIPETASPCVDGVPCSAKYFELLGFITIPMLSFVAFCIIVVLLYMIKERE